MKQVLIYKAYERFWHWAQAFLIIFLLITGFEIHGSFEFFGYRNAVMYHEIAAIAFIILILFTIFWHFTTGEWKQYIPTKKYLKDYINYYLFGIYKSTEHPTKKTVLSKLNPLQKLVYLGLKILVIPVMMISGLVYMFYRYPQNNAVSELNIGGLEPAALIHTAGAFMLAAFLIAHLYLITTGASVTSNLKAMITGYEELEEEESHNNEEPENPEISVKEE